MALPLLLYSYHRDTADDGYGALPLRSPVARSQRLLQRQRDITRCLGALCVLCVRKEYNVRMVIYISRGGRRARKVFIASCAIAGAVVSFATTRVRRGMENGEQTETRSSKRHRTANVYPPPPPCGVDISLPFSPFSFHLSVFRLFNPPSPPSGTLPVSGREWLARWELHFLLNGNMATLPNRK